ncbi:acetamidase/formamidase family protein [Sulfobacillus thermosulfidooxidans]|uniref:acetamidase/formamidase family protein n=1 Tax=Sulfobacillus thermosulfidooxidans TaxID=28034 RepID=UPI00096BD055|nr:acetamidase/formamidase family protein [Sulfobacillus thermosulfidooxidans]OLZ11580.1 acetamidase [Sulfobacillus thermosulfidooxidans]OLZ17422.1 acetamidase [Sulfobacillus thermosulfidooxidans]OLZ21068.1 acetamidase [Sulfobacillus thermosulfidooxidans]
MQEIYPVAPYPYTFGRYHEPIAQVKLNEMVVLYTEDCFEGRVQSEEDLPSVVAGKYLNPQTGPIYIEGAEPGDQLVVHIHDITLTRDWAVSAQIPFFGGLTATTLTATLQDPLPEKVWIYRKQADGRFAYSDRFSIAPAPFMGTIGTAPDLEALSALTPFMHGGNMDVPDVKAGNTVYLPVNVKGAYFSTGDCHVAQGEGEACGVALEISGKITLSFDLIKNRPISWPRIESPKEIMTVGSARPMEDAARIAYSELVKWLIHDFHFDKWDAYQLVSQAGKLYVGNMVDTYYSLVAKLSKEFLT